MKKTTILLLAMTISTCFLAQNTADELTLEDVRAARKTMDGIEKDILRSSDDKHAAALILQMQEATENAYVYLIQTPGYQQALADKTLVEFEQETRSKDKIYKKLAKVASKAKSEKQEYLASINTEYDHALQLYNEATQ